MRIHRRIFPLLAVLLVSSAQAEDDVARLRDNVRRFWTARGADKADPLVRQALDFTRKLAAQHMASARPDGSWPDVNYQELPGGDWSMGEHYARLLLMAQVYGAEGQPLYKDRALRSALERGLTYAQKYVFDGCPQLGNWWWWKVGVGANLGPALFLMQGDLGKDAFDDSLATLRYLNGPEPAGEGENLMWTSMNHFYEGLILADAGKLRKVKVKMSAACRVSGREGMREDGAFHQHGAQLSIGGYGASFALDAARYVLFTRGTEIQLDEPALRDVVNFVADGVRWTIYQNYFDPSALGRQVARAANPARFGFFAMLALAPVPSARQDDFRGAAKHMMDIWNDTYGLEVAGLAAQLKKSVAPPQAPVGHRHYYTSDYSVHRRPGWYASVKMLSDRVVSAEMINGEGKKSWHLSDGMTYVSTRGNEYFSKDAWAALDWERLPGTTVERKTRGPGEGYGKGSRSFVGGVQENELGAAAMDFKANASSAVAKKSWFFFDQEVVCLGTGVGGAPGARLETIVNQRPLDKPESPLVVDGRKIASPLGWEGAFSSATWAHFDDVGYYFPGGQNIKGKRALQAGSWADIGGGSTAPHKAPFITLWFDHARGPAYRYAIVPGKTAPQMSVYAASNPVQVLRQDDAVHAVRAKKLKAVGAVFWQPGEVDIVSVDKPAVLVYRRDDKTFTLAASDPSHQKTKLHVTVKASLAAAHLPPDVGLDKKKDRSIITYDLREGKTLTATFTLQ